jgi:hypothetical protein
MVAQLAAPTVDQIHEDTSVFPNMARSTNINDDTTSVAVNTLANYELSSTVNAGDAYEIHGS